MVYVKKPTGEEGLVVQTEIGNMFIATKCPISHYFKPEDDEQAIRIAMGIKIVDFGEVKNEYD